MSYKVQFEKRLVHIPNQVSPSDIELVKIVQLPFPPYPGLLISDGDFEEHIGEGCIGWDCERQLFVICTTDVYVGDKDHVEVAKKYLELGWAGEVTERNKP